MFQFENFLLIFERITLNLPFLGGRGGRGGGYGLRPPPPLSSPIKEGGDFVGEFQICSVRF
jgi:hypothetical protein